MSDKLLHYGMVGGALDSMIGETHRNAILLDGRAELVCGCFSRDLEKTLKTGKKWGIKEGRLYKDYLEENVANINTLNIFANSKDKKCFQKSQFTESEIK